MRKAYALASAVNSDLIVSAATVTWGDAPHAGCDPKTGRRFTAEQFCATKSAPMNRVFQDWRAWMKEGIIDLNCQMSYYRESKHPDYFRHWIAWGKDNRFGRFVVPARGAWLNPIKDTIRQIEAIRKPTKRGQSAHGVMLYCYNVTHRGPDSVARQSEDFFSALSQPSSHALNPPFAKTASPPRMPWKESRKFSLIHGNAFNSESLMPIDGAKMTLTGNGIRRTQLTEGTRCPWIRTGRIAAAAHNGCRLRQHVGPAGVVHSRSR